MFRISNDWLPIFLVFALCRGTQGGEPEISPVNPEIHINNGESLNLTCMSTEPIRFYYPEDVKDSINTSTVMLEEEKLGNTWNVVFRRPSAVHGDTGWYGCAAKNVDVTPGRYDEPNVKWTYVYVKSSSYYFVQNDTYESFRQVLGGTATIPCRPTSPDYKVILSGNDDTEIVMGRKASYDPRIGFKLMNITLKDSGYFRCSIQHNDVLQDVNYHLYVMRKQQLNEPKIIKDSLRHVTRGQTLRVNCTADVDTDILYVFNWTTPLWSERISTNEYKKTIAVNKDRVTYELTVKTVTEEDEGDYECAITTFSDKKNVSTYITIHDPNIKYINLTPQDNDGFYQKKYGDQVQWVVYVDAYPQPTLKWLSPKGDDIVGSWMEPNRSKHAIQTSPSSTTLRINRLDLYDTGIYTLQATNEVEIKTLNFTLEIIAKPVLILEELEAFYMPRQGVKIPCHVAAFPTPNISWTFLKTPNYPSLEGSQLLPLKNSSMVQKAGTSFLSVVSMTIDDFGDLTATACNTLGCDSVTGRIFVSDVPSGFGLIEPSEALTEGDDVKVTCAASIHNYTGVEWLDKDENPLGKLDQVITTTDQTRFTHRSELHIKSVRKSDNGSHYVCRAMDNNNYVQHLDYELIIYDPEPPDLESNMNKTEIMLDLSTEGHKTLILTCYARGTPLPNVTWYKDETRITDDDQYMLLHNHQELHIKYLLDENNGRYKCEAENRFGKKENYQILTIKGKELSKVLIISIVVLVVICFILVIYFSIKMHREKVMRKQLMEAGLTHFEEGALECLNPELTVDDQAELLPYDKKWEFPRERLKFGKQLGFGAFGVVMKAEAQGICEDEAVTTVAVKMVRRTTESTYIRALASELKIMVHLGKHLNVVNLLGACTKNITKRELLVIVEYCRFGNLHNYLFRHRADFINQIDPASGKLDPTIGLDILTRTTSIGSNNRIKYAALSFSRSLSGNSGNSNPGAELVSYTAAGTYPQSIGMSPDGCVLSNNSAQPGWRSNYSGDYKDQNLKPICTQDLLSWAFQVARGMEYLSQRKVLHGDLAARNILLAENNIVKICDFGLAKTMYKDDNYKKKGDAPLPIKWMAIESIRDRIFSTQSDIWSFGIVLWEFFTLAKTPYPGMEAEKQYQRLIEGYRMEQPEYATDEVYDIMLQCWKAKPTLRPTFTNLVASIGDLLEESVKEHYVDLNAPYLDMNTMVLESGKNDYLTMMSAPDHDALSSPVGDYVNSPCLSPGGTNEDSYLPMSPSSQGSESGIFSPRIMSDVNKFHFPLSDNKASTNSDSDSEAVELSPMLAQEEEDNYLKPINVHERRAEFAKQRQALKTPGKTEAANGTDLGYCNAPRNLGPIDLNDAPQRVKRTGQTNLTKDAEDYAPSIIRTQDNYVNMPKQKNNLRKEGPPASFSNPSYIVMDNRQLEQPGM